MRLHRRNSLIIGLALLIIGIVLFFSQPLGFIIVLYPVWFLFDLNYPIITISYLLFYGGVIVILYTVLEGAREHSWREILPYLFLLFVLVKDYFVLVNFVGWAQTRELLPGAFVFLDSLLVLFLAFLLPRFKEGAMSRKVVFWVYLYFGILLWLSTNY